MERLSPAGSAAVNPRRMPRSISRTAIGPTGTAMPSPARIPSHERAHRVSVAE